MQEKPDYHPLFVYSISFTTGNESSGFFVRNEGIRFPYLGQWAEDALQEQKPPVRISKNAVNDMINSWIFKKYKLVMNNKQDVL